MPVIVRIGYCDFLAKNEAAAAKAMAALVSLTPITCTRWGGREVWFPDDKDYSAKIALTHVRASQLLPERPKKVIEEVEQLQLPERTS